MVTKFTLIHNTEPFLGGKVLLGRDNFDKNIYAWDNEFGSEIKVETFLDPKLISKSLFSGFETIHSESDVGQ